MVPFLTAHGRRLDRTKPDGNCLFRSLSKQLCHNAEYHNILRVLITEYAATNSELFSGWTIQNLSFEEHLRRMKNQGVWGSHLEIKAAATLFNKTIYVVSDSLVPGECRWEAFSPFLVRNAQVNESKFTVTNHKSWLEIAYSGQCHYDGVIPIRLDVPPTPPILIGKTLFITEIL